VSYAKPLTTAVVEHLSRDKASGLMVDVEILLATTRALDEAEADATEAWREVEAEHDGAVKASARAAVWKDLAEAAQADVERLTNEKAELVAALERLGLDCGLIVAGDGCADRNEPAESWCDQCRALDALAKAKCGG